MPDVLRQILQHLRRLVTAPREELSLFQRTLAFWTRLVVYCAGELKRDKAQQIAAALTYHTLFSLVPMLVLGFLVFQSVRGLESSAERFENLVLTVLLPDNALDPNLSPAERKKAILWRRIDEILWNDWDPIGVNEYEEARDEYHGYIPEIYSRLDAKESGALIADRLHRIASCRMGLSLSISSHSKAARLLKAAFDRPTDS